MKKKKEDKTVKINKKKKNKNDLPWIEKYRPKKLKDIITNPLTKKQLNRIIELGDVPNLILTGIPGVGKTSTSICLSKEHLKEHYKDGLLELNASDDRGIKSIEIIENFCRRKLTKDKYKIIHLDEADNMIDSVQEDIALLMEKYYNTTRFILTCNSSVDIVEGIQDRCIILRYSRVPEKQMKERLIEICIEEDVPYSTKGIELIAKISNGDMRHAINCLQLVFLGKEKITTKMIEQICDLPSPLVIRKAVDYCRKQKLQKALDIIYKIKKKGFSVADIIYTMITSIKHHDDLDDGEKIEMIKIISETLIMVSKGLATDLQLNSCISRLCFEKAETFKPII